MGQVAVNNNYRNLAAGPEEGDRRQGYRGKPLELIVRKLAGKARADNTTRNYRTAQRQYRAWCWERGVDPLEATSGDLAQYLGHLAVEAGYPPQTVGAKLAAIRRMYRDAKGRENISQSEEVRAVWSGIQREFAQRPLQAQPLTLAVIRVILAAMMAPGRVLTVGDARDIALLLVGYAGAFRRSEIASLRVEDLRFEARGVVAFLRRSKGDQLQRGEWVGIGHGEGVTCPVGALRRWLDIAPGGVFVFRPVDRWRRVHDRALSEHAVGKVVKGLVECAGLAPEGYSAHSLRAGMITDLVASGLSLALVMERSRHRSPQMIPVYHRPESALATNFTQRAGA